MRSSRHRHFSALFAVSLVVIGAAVGPQDPAPAKPAAPPRTEVQQALDEIRSKLLTGGQKVAADVADRLRELGARPLEAKDRESWLRSARDGALRLGDRKWLESLRDVPDSFSNQALYTVLLAMAQLERADLAAARATLASVDLDDINPREQRRAYSIQARIAQLENDVVAERTQIELMVEHLAMWPKQRCQSCHGPVNQPEIMSSLPITNLWFGERYVELMRRQGDAGEVRREAEARLAADASDDDARIRLAFALLALDDAAAAEQRFRELPWAAFPERDLRKPRMMTSFP